MLTLHHLNNSRSQRILWLLEELKVEYDIIYYKRDKGTNLAPDELKKIHPLGKSPVITYKDKTLIESAAITTFIVEKYADNSFYPRKEDDDYFHYLELLHYAEGSATLPFLLLLYSRFLGDGAKPLEPRIYSEIKNHLGYLSSVLGDNEFFFRNQFSPVDIMLSFVFEGAMMSRSLEPFSNLKEVLKRYQDRDAYKKAIEIGGTYTIGTQ